MNRQELLTSFYVQKDYNTLKQKLIRSKRADELEILAQIYLIEQNYSGARKIYEQLKMPYETGRCRLLEAILRKQKSSGTQLKKKLRLFCGGTIFCSL